MKKIVLFFLALSVIAASCDKTIKPPLQYTVTNDLYDSIVQDIFIPDTGLYTMPVKVKFLTGFQGDSVKLVLSGLPANVEVTPDTIQSVPTFSQDFVFHTTHAALGTYPVTITAYTAVGYPQVYNFNITVIPADCAALFWGNLYSYNTCTSRSYNYTAIGTSSGQLNTLWVSNFGGYGAHCNVKVVLNCNNDSLHIARADYGNGVTLSGTGIFNSDSMVIWYDALSTPTGGPESCKVVLKN